MDYVNLKINLSEDICRCEYESEMSMDIKNNSLLIKCSCCNTTVTVPMHKVHAEFYADKPKQFLKLVK
jgi:hypothetical protein